MNCLVLSELNVTRVVYVISLYGVNPAESKWSVLYLHLGATIFYFECE